jgi:hypothetical protein
MRIIRVLALGTAVLFTACSDVPAPVAPVAVTTLSATETAALEYELIRSEEVADFIRVRDELTARAKARNVTPEMVRAAYISGDAAALQSLFGLSARESNHLTHRLRTSQMRLQTRFPVLRSLAEGTAATSGPACGADVAARALVADSRRGKPSTSIEADPSAGGCKWVQYTIALLLCSTGGPVVYWPCAYLAYCSLCTDDFAICY